MKLSVIALKILKKLLIQKMIFLKNFYINSDEKMNYIFNSSIAGIEDTDLILLVGTNPRHEASILNARIRKTFVQKKSRFFQ